MLEKYEEKLSPIEDTSQTETRAKSEANNRWIEFWPDLQKAAMDSEEHFDKKFFAVSTGALGLSMTIVQFVKEPDCKWLFIVAAIAFLLSLSLNLVVHLYSKHFQDIQSDLIDEYINSDQLDDNHIHERIIHDNANVLWINISSLIIFFIGVVVLAMFLFINL